MSQGVRACLCRKTSNLSRMTSLRTNVDGSFYYGCLKQDYTVNGMVIDVEGIVTLPLSIALACIVSVLVLFATLVLVLRAAQEETRRPSVIETFGKYPQWTEWCTDIDGDFAQKFTQIAMKRLDNRHLCSILIVSVRAWNRGVEGIIFVNKHSSESQVLKFIQPGKAGDIAILAVDYASSPNTQLATAFFDGGGLVEEVSLESNVFEDLRAHIIVKQTKDFARTNMRSGLAVLEAVLSPIIGKR